MFLSLDVPTRWNSTFEMLETTLKYWDVFLRMDIPTNPQLDLDWELKREREDSDDENESGGNGESEVQLETGNYGAPTESDWKMVEGLVIF